MSVVKIPRHIDRAPQETARPVRTKRSWDRMAAAAWYGVLAAVVLHPLLGSGYLLLLDWTPTPTSLGPITGPFAVHDAPLLALLELLPVPTWILQRAILLAAVWGAGMAAHLTAPVRRVSARLLAGTLYALTPFVYTRILAGHWRLLVAYALAPLAVRAIVRLARDPSHRSGLIAGLWIVGVAAVVQHATLLLGVAVIALAVSLALGAPRRRALATFATTTLVVAAGSLWWLIPAWIHGLPPGAAAVDVYHSASIGGESLGLTLLGMRGFWIPGFNPAEPAVWPLLTIGLLTLTLLGMAVAVRNGRRHAALIMFVSGAIALFVAMGVASPVTAPLARAMYRWVPGWEVMREPHKAVALIALGHAWFGAVAFEWLLARRLAAIRYGAAALLALPFLLTPQVLGGLGGRLDPTPYPKSWSSAERHLQADPDRFSVVALPWQLYVPLPWVGWGDTFMDPAREYFSRPVLASDDAQVGPGPDPGGPTDRRIESLVESYETLDRLGSELATLGVKYVLLLPDGVPGSYGFLFDQEDLKVEISSDGIVVFRNTAWEGSPNTPGAVGA